MDVRRVRLWDWLTGLAGIALLVSLFLPWYEVGGGGDANAWESFAVTDVVLALAALAAVALPVLAATQRTAAVPQTYTAWIVLIGLIAAVFALIRVVNAPDLGASVDRALGVWLGAASVLGVLVFGWRSMGDKRFPAAMRPRLDVATIPTPSADGERRDVAQ
jgi:hypothetical protein